MASHLPARILPAVVAVALLAAACGDSDTAAPAGNTPPVDGQASDQPAGDASMPSGQRTLVSGEMIDLADYDGSDVILWFWAPW